MLKLSKVSKVYGAPGGEIPVLADVSLTMQRGESLAVMGPSGSGKSTLLNIIGTLDAPTGGSILFDGINPFTLEPRSLCGFRNRTIGFVFQEHHLLPQCTVLENVLVPTLAGESADLSERAADILCDVGLENRLHHRPGELSGGERQRVAVARALINRPSLLLADEPTGNLDVATAARIVELLASLQRQFDTTLIVVTHSKDAANRFQTQAVLRDGRLERE